MGAAKPVTTKNSDAASMKRVENRRISMKKSMFILMAILLCAVPAAAQQSGWLGISIEDQTDRGALIRRVEPNSPAARAGLREGDVVIEFNKEPVIGVQQLTRLIRETPAGRTVEVRVRRENREETFQVTTESASRSGRAIIQIPDSSVLRDRLLRRVPPLNIRVNTSIDVAGIRVEQMTDQLRDFFGVLTNAGVLVSSVEPNSAAERAGLKTGDVVTSVDGRNIRTPAEFSREMRSTASKVTLKIVREKQERDILIERGTQ
jgi:serine protease Do